jgi:hypothetical protein
MGGVDDDVVVQRFVGMWPGLMLWVVAVEILMLAKF